ncbi:MAG: PaaI family thioesterase [Pseudomonadota bacterium]
MGIEVRSADESAIVAELTVTEALCTTGKIMHGGAIMAFADTLGAIGAFMHLPDGAKATTTLESKTNFLGGAPLGSVVVGTCTPVHVGRRTSVWQTRLATADDKAVAMVTQTQLVLS